MPTWPTRAPARGEGAVLNRTAAGPGRAAWLVPPVFGVIALIYGQDSNWDLRNYHLHNAWAFLEGRLGLDLAPAGIQSYFNPLMDVPYYLMALHWPAPVAGLVMGLAHGLNFVLVLAIARRLLAGTDHGPRTPVLLALAGCLGAAFLAELGNTMGNNLTALGVLGGLLAVVVHWQRFTRADGPALAWMALAGGLLGVAAGLKLTNAVYALALCLAVLFWLGAEFRVRLVLSAVFGLAVLAGLALSAGFWHLRLWQEFGNPLFPQFNAIFASPLAAETMIADRRWMPEGWAEALAWPLVFTLDPSRVGDKPIPQAIWALVYLLFLAWAVLGLAGRGRRRAGDAAAAGRGGFLLGFLAVAFVLWAAIFGIYRYLAALELLAPLAVWLIFHRLVRPGLAGRLAGVAITVCLAWSLVNWTTWGNRPWAAEAFRVTPPEVADPERARFVLAGPEPLAWLLPFLPAEARYVSLGQMPESEAWLDEVRELIEAPGAQRLALIAGHASRGEHRLERLNAWLEGRGVQAGDFACGALDRLAGMSGSVGPAEGRVGDCRFEIVPERRADLEAANALEWARVARILEAYGYGLDEAGCRVHPAWIGAAPEPYQTCPVRIEPRRE